MLARKNKTMAYVSKTRFESHMFLLAMASTVEHC